MIKPQKAYKSHGQLEYHIKYPQKQNNAVVGTGYEPEEGIKRIGGNTGHQMELPVVNQINIALKEAVETVGIIHFIIVIDTVKSPPDKSQADQEQTCGKYIVNGFEVFHRGRPFPVNFFNNIGIISKLTLEVKAAAEYNRADKRVKQKKVRVREMRGA